MLFDTASNKVILITVMLFDLKEKGQMVEKFKR